MSRTGVPDDAIRRVAAAGADDAGGLPVELLGDFLDVLSVAVCEGSRCSVVSCTASALAGKKQRSRVSPCEPCSICISPRPGVCGVNCLLLLRHNRIRTPSSRPAK